MVRGQLQKFVQFLLSHKSHTENENQGIPLLVSFLLAVILWFLVTLNQTYQAILIFPIQITQLPASLQVQDNEEPLEMRVLVEGIGLDLLLAQLKWNRKDTLSINFQEEFRRGFFSPQKYFNQINENLSDNLFIKQIITDSIFCSFDQLKSKNVKLVDRVQILLDPAVELFSRPILDPDSITIVGPESVLDSIISWPTVSMTTPRLSQPVNIDVPIPDTIENIQLSHSNAKLFVNPEYYTQTQIKAHLQILAIPKDTKVRLATDSIKINLLITMEKFDNLYDTPIKMEIHYEDLDPEIPFIVPQIAGILPEYVKLLSYTPLKIPYVIVTKK